MKKTLLAICMVAMGFLAVSCYDDSKLWTEVESLGKRVDQLEKDLKADVANLTTLQNKVNSLETSLTEAIAAGDAAVKKALEDKLSALETKLTAAQQAGDQAIIAELAKEKTAIENAIKSLQDGLKNITSSVEALEAALKAFEATVGENYKDLLAKLDAVDGKIDGKVTDMTAALATLKGDLEAALAEAIAKIAVTDVEKKDGKIVLTLADGSKIEVSAPLENVENTGLVTIVEEEGVKYWAVVEADGTVKSLGVVVGHPDQEIDFQVDDATGELEYSVNGGEWIGTGIVAEVKNENAVIVTDFVDGEGYVSMKIGGVEVVLPKYMDDALLEASNAKFYLRYEGIKEINLTVDGVEEFYVMAKPDGWRTEITEENILVVEAPTYKQLEADAAELEGEILIHGTTVTGSCMITRIEVRTGPGLTMDLKPNGDVTITNAFAAEEINNWGESMGFNFTNFFVGFATDSIFTADTEAYMEYYKDNYGFPNNDVSALYYNNYDIDFRPYEEGVYEVDTLKSNVIDLYKWMTWGEGELPYGETTVFWICGVDEHGYPDPKTLCYADFTNIKVGVEVASVTHNEVVLNLDLAGADKYYVGVVADPMAAYNTPVDEFLQQSSPWNMLVNGYPEYIEDVAVVDSTKTVALSLANYESPLDFNTKYYYWVFPYVEGAVYSDYEGQFKPYVLEVTTLDLQAGSTCAVTVSDEVITYTSVKFIATPSEGTEAVYYSIYSAEEWAELEEAGDDAIRAALFEDCYYPMTEADEISKTYLDPEETIVFAAISVDKDGKYGEVVVKSYTTLTVPSEKNEAYTATFGEPVLGFDSITVNVAPATGTTAYWTYMTDAALSTYTTDNDLVGYLIKQRAITEATDLKVTYLSQNAKRTLVVAVIGADNKYNLYKNEYTTKAYPYSEALTIALDSAVAVEGKNNTYTLTFSVTGAEKVAFWCYYNGSASTFESNVVSKKTNLTYVDVVDGKATVTFTGNSSRWVYAMPYVETDGAVTAIAKNYYSSAVSALVQ